MSLSKQSILKHAGIQDTKVVHVPKWRDENGDDAVIVRGMTVREFEVNQAKLGRDEGDATAALVARCVVDESGGRVFDDSDIPVIAELGFGQVNEIGKAISDLSGLSDSEEGQKEKAAEIEGNSAAAQSGSSSSGSPDTSSIVRSVS